MTDSFRGDNAALCASITALLELDAAGALVPHGVGGHARGLLESAAARLLAPVAGGVPAHGSLQDFTDAADLVDKLGQAATKGEMLALVLRYRLAVRSASPQSDAEQPASSSAPAVGGVLAYLVTNLPSGEPALCFEDERGDYGDEFYTPVFTPLGALAAPAGAAGQDAAKERAK